MGPKPGKPDRYMTYPRKAVRTGDVIGTIKLRLGAYFPRNLQKKCSFEVRQKLQNVWIFEVEFWEVAAWNWKFNCNWFRSELALFLRGVARTGTASAF